MARPQLVRRIFLNTALNTVFIFNMKVDSILFPHNAYKLGSIHFLEI